MIQNSEFKIILFPISRRVIPRKTARSDVGIFSWATEIVRGGGIFTASSRGGRKARRGDLFMGERSRE